MAALLRLIELLELGEISPEAKALDAQHLMHRLRSRLVGRKLRLLVAVDATDNVDHQTQIFKMSALVPLKEALEAQEDSKEVAEAGAQKLVRRLRCRLLGGRGSSVPTLDQQLLTEIIAPEKTPRTSSRRRLKRPRKTPNPI